MVVYADVLIFLNTIINYFLILLTKKIGKNFTKTFRHALGAFVGALFSLTIFLPHQNFLVEIILRLLCSCTIVKISFGFIHIKKFLKNIFIFFTISFIYAGAMLGIWLLFKPYGMIINNSIVYFSFSPTLLIILSLLFYLIIVLLRKIFSEKTCEKRLCEIKIKCLDNTINTMALIDSGHNLTDFISDKDIVFLSKSKACILFNDTNPELLNDKLKSRYRAIPCQTVTDTTILPAFRCDEIKIYYNNKTYIILSPIIVITQTIDNNDYSAIISPKIIERC